MEVSRDEQSNVTSQQNDKRKKSTSNGNVRSVDAKKLRSSLKSKNTKGKSTTKASKLQNANEKKDERPKKETEKPTESGEKRRRRRRRFRKSRILMVQQRIVLESQKADKNSLSLLRKVTSKSLVFFVALYSLAMCLQGAVERYTEGVRHQSEYKYYFTSYTNVICSVLQSFGMFCSLCMVAFFARNAQKPFLIFVGLLISSLGSIVWSVPSFLDKNSFKQLTEECSQSNSLNYFYSDMCRNDSFMIDETSLNFLACSKCVSQAFLNWWSFRELRFFLICLGDFLIGVGGGLYVSLGFLYVDENSEGNRPYLKYGVIFSMAGLGQVVGSVLAWWFLQYEESLSGMAVVGGQGVRAWWLGTVITAVCFFFLSWFFLVFPKWIKEPNWVVLDRYETIQAYKQLIAYLKEKKKRQREYEAKKRNQKRNKSSKNKSLRGTNNAAFEHSDGDNNLRSAAPAGSYENKAFEHPSPDSTEDAKSSSKVAFSTVMTSTIEIEDPYDPAYPSPAYIKKPKPKVSKKLGKRCSALRDLFSIPAYSLFLVAMCLSSYYLAAFRPVSNVFAHHNYNYSLFKSWFYISGLSDSLGWMLGSLVGGIVIYKLRMALKSQLLLMITSLVFHCAFFFFIFALSCEHSPVDDPKLTDCLEKHKCLEMQLEKVCMKKEGGALEYQTPCHAACHINGNGSCGNFDFSMDSCEATCPIFAAYGVLVFLASFTYALPAVTVVVVFLRTIDEENKTMALSTALAIIKLLAYVPGKSIFDEILLSTCTEFHKNCLGESYCWAYHHDHLRYLLHGTNIAFQAGAILLLILIFTLVTTKKISLEYHQLIASHSDEAPNSVVPAVHKSKRSVDAIRSVSKMEQAKEVGVERSGNNSGKKKEEMDRQLSTEEKLRRHLQVVEMQLEKQGTPRSSNDHLNLAGDSSSNPSDAQHVRHRLSSLHGHSNVSLHPVDERSHLSRQMSQSDQNLQKSNDQEVREVFSSDDQTSNHYSSHTDIPTDIATDIPTDMATGSQIDIPTGFQTDLKTFVEHHGNDYIDVL